MMNLRRNLFVFTLMLLASSFTRADETEWSGAADNNFFNDSNWTSGAPTSSNDLAIIDEGMNLPAVIAADTGVVEIGAVSLGRLDGGGHVVQNGGTLVIVGEEIDAESQIGDIGADGSSWIMNGDSMILYDDPLGGDGDGLDSDGSGKDFDLGKSVPEGAVGRLELHDNAIIRISDDLKIADGDLGNAELLLDGNSQITVGSGISASGTNSVTVAGNALLLSGNSAGPGNSGVGRTDEGYFTLSTGDGETANIEVKDSGRVWVRTLQQRGGVSSVTVRDDGQFHIFEVFENAEPNLGSATVEGSTGGPQRTSHVSSSATAETTITLLGNAVMTIDSDLDDSGWSGFAMSGGTNRGANAEGGETLLEVADNATFTVQQDLHMTLGIGEDASSTLKVRGPDATVTINGDLRMALDDFDDENLGTATIHAEVTANSHSTINVGGTAFIGNGDLLVTFTDYDPRGGEMYELIAGSTDGEFRGVSLPELVDGLSWDLAIGETSVLLSILGGLLAGDFNGNGVYDAEDIDLLSAEVQSGDNTASFDLNNDAQVNDADRDVWVEQLAFTYYGDSNLDGEFGSGDLVLVFGAGKYDTGNAASWAEGDWNGDALFNSSDLVKAFQTGGFELGPRGVAAVPEPGVTPLVCGMLVLLAWRRRR